MDKSVKRQNIVEKAKHRFRKYGLRKTAMHEIASDAGLSVGTLYLYFKNKEELVIACSELFAEKHRQAAREILSSQMPPQEKLLHYVLNRYRAVEDTRVSSSHAAEIARAVIKLRPERFAEDNQWLFENVLAILNEGLQLGVFRIEKAERDAEIFVQAITYFLPVAGMEPYFTPTEAKLIKMVEWFIDKWQEPLTAESQKKKGLSKSKEKKK